MSAVIDQVILGGMTGPGAVPLHPDWVRKVRDDCAAAGVPFFFKQWGEWTWGYKTAGRLPSATVDGLFMCKIGKKMTCRLLDGREYNDLAWDNP